MPRKKKSKSDQYVSLRKSDMTFILVALLLLGIIIGTVISPSYVAPISGEPGAIESARTVVMGIPAVDTNGNGVIGELTTSVSPGRGSVSVNVDINNPLSAFDTQQSARTAKIAAANYTGKDLSSVDIDFSVKVNAPVIEGPSAGAAMAVSIILALNNQTASDDVVITGTIGSDGSIGRVGSILAKARASGDAGAEKLLVPDGQSVQTENSRTRECEQRDGIRVCRITYESMDVQLSGEVDIEIVEVSNVGDALPHFSGGSGELSDRP